MSISRSTGHFDSLDSPLMFLKILNCHINDYCITFELTINGTDLNDALTFNF